MKPVKPHPRRALDERPFLLLLAVVTLAFAWIVEPLFSSILWASILAIIFRPLYERILQHMQGRATAAAAVTTVVVVVIVICPFVVVTVKLLQEALAFYQLLHSADLALVIPAWVSGALERLGVTSLAEAEEKMLAGLQQNFQLLATHASRMWHDLLGFALRFIVTIYLLFFLLRDGAAVLAHLAAAIPLPARLQREFANRFAAVIHATVKGDVVVSAMQGALGGLAFWALGIPGALFWSVVMAILAFLPIVGTVLVWLPAAIYLIAYDAVWQGIALIAYGVLVLGGVDTFLRPVLVGRRAKLPDSIVLVSTLGGIAVLGFDGIVVGPIVAAMFIAGWETRAQFKLRARTA